MPSLRYPILVWQGFDGSSTAALVESDDNVAAIADTASRATEQLKDYLQWKHKTEPWTPKPEFLDAKLAHVKVEVRPEYTRGTRVYPSEQCVALRVPVVHGKDAGGLLLCALPTLGIRFTYYEQSAMRGLVGHTVQSALKGLTPQQLSRCLPPPVISLEELSVFIPSGDRERDRKGKKLTELTVLPTAADAIGAREFRSRFSRAWEREGEVNRLITMLGQERASVLLVGESGSGKTSILVEAVRKLERGGVDEKAANPRDESKPIQPHDRRFWMTSGSRLIAGMRYLGQWQERVEEMIAEISAIDGVLCLENLLDAIKTGGQGPIDGIASFLMPYLQRRDLRLVAEVTPAELDACRRLLPGLAEMFQIIAVEPMTRQQAIAALGHVAEAQEQNLHTASDRGVVEMAYRLFSRFLPYQSFPGRAAAFLAGVFDVAARQKIGVTASVVIDRFIRQSGLPELLLRDEIPLHHADVAASLQAQVIGQDTACATAAGVITTLKAGLNDPGRPVGVLLFCGPTGVGKTELARAISRFLFGHGEQKDRLLRLDMSEYQHPGSAARLMTDAQGNASEFIQRIRQQPFTVVLLDEIEKAAGEVFDVLLSVFDEGRLTDRSGRLTSFKSAVIIMTSNLGATSGDPFGFARAEPPKFDAAAMGFFRPEFVNRIDSIVTFTPLSNATILAITTKELSDLSKREGFTKAGLSLTWTPEVVSNLAAAGYDPRYGARPLQRTVETRLVTPLAKFIVQHPALRDATIHVDLDADSAIRISLGQPKN